jgi:hypothetical protein
MRVLVKLSIPGSGKFEITPTVNISSHGTRVVTRSLWKTNEHLLVRSIRGNLYSRARVAYCQSLTDDSYAVGLQLYHPTKDWTTLGERPGGVDSAREHRTLSEPQTEQEKAIEVFREIYEMLEDYAPAWYSEELHERAKKALRVLGRR